LVSLLYHRLEVCDGFWRLIAALYLRLAMVGSNSGISLGKELQWWNDEDGRPVKFKVSNCL